MLLNEALKVVGSKLAKAERRLKAEPNNPNRKAVRDNLAIKLEALVAQARDGRVYEFTDRNARRALKVQGSWETGNVHSV